MSVADEKCAVLEWLSPLEPHERPSDKKTSVDCRAWQPPEAQALRCSGCCVLALLLTVPVKYYIYSLDPQQSETNHPEIEYCIFSCFTVFCQGRCLEPEMGPQIPPASIVTKVWILGVYNSAAE